MAGRLHVEVWRGTEGAEEEAPDQSDAQQGDTDGDPPERKLDCVVRTRNYSSVNGSVSCDLVLNEPKDIQESPHLIICSMYRLSLTHKSRSYMQ